MAVTCDDLVPFVDGELEAARAEEFRGHLAGCEECVRNLGFEVQLGAAVAGMAPPWPVRARLGARSALRRFARLCRRWTSRRWWS